ncbi:UbiA family prenyltransferase [Nocardioides dongxiaopingii]|uniref:UbiA family prenyltransferase n=1 Tax=Nocardioides dongxiaopingii TaxID=2576036 RepID=UPI0010C76802|nr:UbiA family prenyltransferase [Nocardioides dongxiaopingii]
MAKQQRWRRGGTADAPPPDEPVEARPATAGTAASEDDDGVVEARPRTGGTPAGKAPAKPVVRAPATKSATTSAATSSDQSARATTTATAPTGKPAKAPAAADTSTDTGTSTSTDTGTTEATAPTRTPTTDREPAAAEPTAVAPADAAPSAAGRLRLSVLDSAPVTLLLAAHPRQALLTALALGVAALAAGRPTREAAVVAATVLVGQTILGWHNDIVDRDRDARHQLPHKPVAEGRLETGSVWYAIVVAVLLVVPLSISTGVTAGTCYLLALAVGLLGNVVLRRGALSWVPWAASFALYPAYLSYGGWGGSAEGAAPEVPIVVLAALLGVGVHFVRSVWGLVPDDADGWSHLPLVLGRRLGATRLLVVSGVWTAAVVALLAIVGSSTGLRQ